MAFRHNTEIMTIFDYDELKITTPNTPLSVERWNGLVDQLNRVERTLNSVYQNGRIGIGTIPEHALHIEGTGGVDDDVFIHSSGSTHSAALIFAKSSPGRAPVKMNDMLGSIAFRGETGEGFNAGAGINAYATGDFNNRSTRNTELLFYTNKEGTKQENLRLTDQREMIVSGRVRIEDKSQGADGKTLVLGPTDQSNLRLGYHKNYSWVQSHYTKPLAINPIGNNVGIGTYEPTEKLQVAGKVYANAFTGPDGGRLVTRKGWGGTSSEFSVQWLVAPFAGARLLFLIGDEVVATIRKGAKL